MELIFARVLQVNVKIMSYSYMDGIINSWNEMGILKDIMQHKLVFIETQDVAEKTLALVNYNRSLTVQICYKNVEAHSCIMSCINTLHNYD
jgi:hypothetical protein